MLPGCMGGGCQQTGQLRFYGDTADDRMKLTAEIAGALGYSSPAFRERLHTFREFQPGARKIVELIAAQAHQIDRAKSTHARITPPARQEGYFSEILPLPQASLARDLTIRHFSNDLHFAGDNDVELIAYISLAEDVISWLIMRLVDDLCPNHRALIRSNIDRGLHLWHGSGW